MDQNTVWVHDARGERQISVEGSAGSPRFSADGSRVFYLSPPDLWVVDLQSGRLDRVLPGVSVTDYALSPDSKAIAYLTADASLWYTLIDAHPEPRRLAMRAHQPEFTRSGDILFRISSTLYRIRPDGTNEHRMPANPGDQTRRRSYMSPDEQWYVRDAGDVLVVAEHRTGSRIPLCHRCLVHWTPEGRFFWISLRSLNGEGVTGIFRLSHGSMLPPLPPGGVKSVAELSKLPGVRIVPSDVAFPAPDGSRYAYLKVESRWNLYRIPLP